MTKKFTEYAGGDYLKVLLHIITILIRHWPLVQSAERKKRTTAMLPHQVVVVMVDVNLKKIAKNLPIMRAAWSSHLTRYQDRMKTFQYKSKAIRSVRNLRDKRRKYVAFLRWIYDAIIHLRFISNTGLDKWQRNRAMLRWKEHQRRIQKQKVGINSLISSYLFILLQPLLF